MRILANDKNLTDIINQLSSVRQIGFDTETYGTNIDDDMFSMQMATDDRCFYFNFHDYGGPYVFTIRECLEALAPIFRNPSVTWFIHNAKFDMHRLCNYQIVPTGRIHCTQAIARIIYNQHKRYGLDACLRRLGRQKNQEVEDYIRDNKCYEKAKIEGKKKAYKNKHYWKVPFDTMFKYGCQDAEDVLFLGKTQLNEIFNPKLYEKECDLVKACFNMERIGIKTNMEYIQYAKQREKGHLDSAIKQATEQAGEEYRNGPKWLRAAFDKHGQEYRINPDTGNPIFDKHALAEMSSPIAETVKRIRRHEKYIGTYYSSFEHFGIDGIIHANIRQSGTDTGRFSYADPNLQNVPKEEDFPAGEIQVRKCFVPRENHCFVMIDFDQQEFRLMLDYAGENGLIRRIMEHGEDVHQATANMCGITRKHAKTLNFGLLYGMGVEKLAKQLGLSNAQAFEIKRLYFSRLPRVKRLIKSIQDTANRRGYIKTWAGRRLYFPDPEKVYKAPNHLIQGGCGDIARAAMVALDRMLQLFRSNMLVQVHDEILFEIHKDELDIVDMLRSTMERIYEPVNGMWLTCGVEHSWISWGKQDVIDGKPRVDLSKKSIEASSRI